MHSKFTYTYFNTQCIIFHLHRSPSTAGTGTFDLPYCNK